jgi:hypothetical protein
MNYTNYYKIFKIVNEINKKYDDIAEVSQAQSGSIYLTLNGYTLRFSNHEIKKTIFNKKIEKYTRFENLQYVIETKEGTFNQYSDTQNYYDANIVLTKSCKQSDLKNVIYEIGTELNAFDN